MRSLLGVPKMDGLSAVAATTSTSFSGNPFLFHSCSSGVRIRGKSQYFCTKKSRFSVSASKREEPKLNEWDQMELKFGRLLGEDPKLTIAKIMARKVNPDASFVEVEKSFYKNKGKITEVEEIPLNWSKEKKSSKSIDGLNLLRPVPKKGTKFETDVQEDKPEYKRPITSVTKAREVMDGVTKPRMPNVILRKPASYYDEDVADKASKLRLKPNLSLRMRDEQSKETFSDMTLLRKPEPVNPDLVNEKIERTGIIDDGIIRDGDGLNMVVQGGDDGDYVDFTLLNKPEMKSEPIEKQVDAAVKPLTDATEKESSYVMQPVNQSILAYNEENIDTDDLSDTTSVNYGHEIAANATLQGKPQRSDQSVTEASTSSGEKDVVNNKDHESPLELKLSPSRPSMEDRDWSKADDLFTKEAWADVELISSSTRGFAVSFGSLIGFLPYRNLAAKWKFLAFESWLRRKGVDPSVYRQNLGVVGTRDVINKNTSSDSNINSEVDKIIEGEISSDMKLEDLLMIYDQQKQKYLSSFVGQKIKVKVMMADSNSKKLIFSMRPREKEEAVEKKRSLMNTLRVGDVVKCCIKKITFFGIFVEVEGVAALIHQTEVSWDATLDPASYFKIGQVVDAKVHQLDFAMDRIFLSLKEMMPDPLTEALESVVSDHDQFGGKLQEAEADSEWEDVESLINELEKIDGIQSVSKGRFFLSPGLAPTFQVYMASMFENQYKLLARSGNRVQELMVESSLNKEDMKSTIMSCTNRVV